MAQAKSKLLYQSWQSADPKAVFLLVYGLGAHLGRWKFLADFLLAKNYSAYALELKGFGETPDTPRGHIHSFKIYYQDMNRLLTIIKNENPNKKIILLGESLGALLAFKFAALYPQDLTALICISVAFKNVMRFSLLNYFLMVSALLYAPRRQFEMPFTAAMCTRDTSYQAIMNQDPRELRLASAKLLYETLIVQLASPTLARRIKIPTLFLLAGKDQLVDPKTSRSIFAKIKSTQKKLIEYPEMYHALSIELGREKVFEDMLKWLQEN
jgi:alpha-beta hydrolase superfamily lysophospholipase